MSDTTPRQAALHRIMGVLALAPDKAFRPVEVADLTGLTTHEAARYLRELWVKEQLDRHTEGRRSTYQHKAAA